MRTIFQVAYRNPDSHEMHETGDAREAMALFKRFYKSLIESGWEIVNYTDPEYDGVGVTEGSAVFTKVLPAYGKCAALLHLHIIKV